MNKFIALFLSLFFTLFFAHKKIHASFFNPSPFQQTYGTKATTARWDPSGINLAVGGSNFPQDLTLYEFDGTYLIPQTTQSFNNNIQALDWSPNGKYLAVAGNNLSSALIIYKLDGTDLILTASKYHGMQANAVAWSPNGNTLAVGGQWGNNNLALYNWDGSSSLTLTTSQHFGTQVNALAWHPDGTKLAVAGTYGAQDLILYSWNGSTLATLSTKNHGTQACALAWSNSGNYLAVGGANTPNDVIIYSLSGPTLTQVTTAAFGTQANTLQWSFDDTYLAIGGNNGSTNLIIYKWNGTALTPITSSQTSYGTGVYAVNWTPYADYLAVAGDNGSSDVTIYKTHNYLNGTKNNVTISDHDLFHDNSYAFGSVNFTNGCTVLPTQKLKLELLTTLSGGLDLRNTGILELEDDLYLDSNVTLSAGGYINGQNHAIYLGNNLTIPDNTILHISSDTIIDGNGHILNLGYRSHLFVDSNVTLTLKNLSLESTFNTTFNSPITLSTISSKLALDNVKLAPTNDFYFNLGQLFIHNEVAFTGTSKFVYSSPSQSSITKNATLYFAPHTTLNYAPTTNNNNLLSLEDASSNLYLDGCTLQITHTGLQLTKGQLFLDNNVTFSSAYSEFKLDSTFTYSRKYGSSPYSVAWSPNGTYLAVGGFRPTDKQEIQVFSFNGSSLTYTASADYGPISPAASIVYAVSWSPDGTYLAVGGTRPTDTQEIQVFSFNGTSLTYTASADYGPISPAASVVYAVSWSPDGTYLAVGGTRPTDKQEIKVFSFNGTSLTYTASADYGPTSPLAVVYAVSWSPDGTYLAAGGSSPTDKQEIQVFSFNGTSLTYTASADYGPTGSIARAVSWSPDGTYLAAGGSSPTDKREIKVFGFNGTSLTYTASADYRPNVSATVRAVSWSPDGAYLAANGTVTGTEKNISVFSFDGFSLTNVPAACQQLETTGYSVAWKPDGTSFAATGYTGASNGYLGVYKFNNYNSHQTASTGLIFGNAALGPDYNLNVDVLSGANINQHCFVKFDEAV